MMRLHHFLMLIILSSLLIIAKADEEADYDAGFEEKEKLPEPLPQVQVQVQDQPVVQKLVERNPYQGFSFTEASFYIPVAIVTGIMLNAIIISVLVVLKRKRVVAYRKMQLERASPVFRELQSEI